MNSPAGHVRSLTSFADISIGGSGSLLVNAASTINGDLFVGGAFGGTSSITVNGNLTASGAQFTGVGGSLTLNGDTTLSGGNFITDGFHVTNPTGSTVSASGDLNLYGTGSFRNDGVFEFVENGAIGDSSFVGTGVFENTGVIQRRTGDSSSATLLVPPNLINSGLIDIQVGFGLIGYNARPFTNSGTIRAAAGTNLTLSGPSTSSGVITGDRIRIEDVVNITGSYTSSTSTTAMYGGIRISGDVYSLGELFVSGALDLTGAVLHGSTATLDRLTVSGVLKTDDALVVTGQTDLSNATLSGVGGSLTLNGDTTLSGGNFITDGFHVTNPTGSTVSASGDLNLYGTGSFRNDGVFEFVENGAIGDSSFVGTGVFENTGVIQRRTGDSSSATLLVPPI